MPYDTNAELLLAVKTHLPAHAQDIFRESFNCAWRSNRQSQPLEREAIAFRVARAAAKRRYQKSGKSVG